MRTAQRRWKVGVLAMVLIGGIVPLAVGAGTSGAASKDFVINYPTEAYYINTPELADALGYLPGIKLNPVTNGLTIPPAEFVQVVVEGKADYGYVNIFSLIAAVAQGDKVKGVVAFAGNLPPDGGGYFVKSTSSIKTAKDLIGKSVGVTAGTTDAFSLDLYLKEHGIALSKVPQVQIPYTSGNSGEQEVLSGQLDAFYTEGPPLVAAKANKSLRELFTDDQVEGQIDQDAYFFSDAYIKAHPAIVKEFVAGVAKATKWMQTNTRAKVLSVYEAYLKSHGQSDQVSAFATWTSNGELPGGVFSAKSFTDNAEYLELLGQLKSGQVTESDVLTNKYNPYAG
jgi:ABC-type nitrate/sulfonate/bicarbonate transport system substrate-binding protein